MRGENISISDCVSRVIGSSPHARGKHSRGIFQADRNGLIPACAGKTSMRFILTQTVRAHPRMRGENLHGPLCLPAFRGSSPHARGKQLPQSRPHSLFGLIPACAGKTACWGQRVARAWAHPRMRGENQCPQKMGHTTRGSSPHARGKQSSASPVAPVARLIPACAGKTSWWHSVARGVRAHPRMRGENSR